MIHQERCTCCLSSPKVVNLCEARTRRLSWLVFTPMHECICIYIYTHTIITMIIITITVIVIAVILNATIIAITIVLLLLCITIIIDVIISLLWLSYVCIYIYTHETRYKHISLPIYICIYMYVYIYIHPSIPIYSRRWSFKRRFSPSFWRPQTTWSAKLWPGDQLKETKGRRKPAVFCGQKDLKTQAFNMFWLVVGPSLWKIWFCQLGWLETQYMGK